MAEDCFRIPFVRSAFAPGRLAGPGSKEANRIELCKSRGSWFTCPCKVFIPVQVTALSFIGEAPGSYGNAILTCEGFYFIFNFKTLNLFCEFRLPSLL